MNFTVILIVAVIAFIALAIFAGLLKAKFRSSEASRGQVGVYELRKSIFTPAERSFAGVLDGALPDGVTWLGKVRLGDIFVTRKGLTRSENASARNKIDRKHVDFLLLRTSDLAPLAGIELDDRSHEADARRQRDNFVDDVFRSCDLLLLHVPAQAAYNQTELRTKIVALLGSAQS